MRRSRTARSSSSSNIVFHVIAALGLASAVANQQENGAKEYAAGAFLGFASHGVLDGLPHQYPKSKTATPCHKPP
ncbi:MAG: hypothetical protein GY822_32915, partial [Deltaproteobacteria bacterium]|nr:hypothetical protein [Deltaproteobacteria bacterium]